MKGFKKTFEDVVKAVYPVATPNKNEGTEGTGIATMPKKIGFEGM